ncbi:aldo/keto reductase [Cellulomonas hominis]|uniref:L-galactose dehydrogenase n=1 Tax=Cellulomonas hominis TaxID=156981 RepID=A0A511FBE7_9CELL|nr:aldo/keto reductase [Cellulomonas hominis]MBB5472456.1 L-galactose dehydrogenase [Cellulomonas hominis]MBU5421921.1 aldo/keto reductase [Cellulomonas hominis]NKY08648.1 aldo/keto reductase [Cellulomonas hominis]NKY11835.1 aldo/keto reductase [Cellulomonas hominis]GEL45607.1 oxidoreductase aryl-alcohol dehydrogenase like protein [Cellulomonas hominis]
MQTRPLGRTGLDVPVLSLGAAPFGDVYGDITQDDADATIRVALEQGMNLVDTSPWYGQTRSEIVLGRALRGIDRDAYVLTTKCGRYEPGAWDFSAERIRRSIPESLERLGLDHIDLIQCHDIEWGDVDQVVHEALPVLRELRDQGLVRHIGITGYTLDLLERIAVQEEVDSVMTYCTYNLQDRRLAETAARLEQHGIGVFNASPLHMGALTTKGAPEWHPAYPEVLAATRTVSDLCREAGTTIEVLAMQFALDLPEDTGISTTVVGTANPKNVLRNAAVLGQRPDPELVARVEEAFGPWLNVGWDVPKPAVAGA